LGIADQLQRKTKRPDEDIVGPMVARGEADLGITAISTLLATPGLSVVGPIPEDIQSYVIFTGGVSAKTLSPAAAEALLKFLTNPAAAPAIRAKGLQPS
jgi:molybdate transport system substrate-binding protein